ncbi:MAG: hypothetical protein RIQ62_21, partial [Bacteroidota bacterium]
YPLDFHDPYGENERFYIKIDDSILKKTDAMRVNTGKFLCITL